MRRLAHIACPGRIEVSAMDMPAMLSAQPRGSHWCKQKDVERELGLEGQAISTYVMNLGKGTHVKKIF